MVLHELTEELEYLVPRSLVPRLEVGEMLEDPTSVSALSKFDLLPDNLLKDSSFDSRRVVVRTHAFTSD